MISGLGERLSALRNQHGLSQRAAAASLGISPSVLSGYETGDRTPSVEVLLSLSRLYRCSTDYLLGREPINSSLTIDVSKLSAEQVQALQALINTMWHE